MTTTIENVSRRDFLKAGVVAGAGLTLGVWFGPHAEAAATSAGGGITPNAFVRIGADDSVTVIVKHLEMGQGTYTGLPTLVAEELDAAWSQIRVEGAPADARRYNNLFWGPAQGTGGSTAMGNSFEQMRRAGAAARAMLVAAAAKEWQVPAASIRVAQGVVSHASGRKATFGQLAARAAEQEVPAEVKLKEPAEFIYIGKRAPRTDSRAKVRGTAIFTQDVRLPGMLTAVVARPPRFGARVKSFDAARAKAVKGVVEVVAIPNGVAVLAKDFWSAKKGRDALAVSWDESGAFRLGTAEILAQYRELAKQPGAVAAERGDVAKALAGAAKVIEADYEFPYLAHAAMEPLNCVVRLADDGCEVWNGEQLQTVDQYALAGLLGLKPEQVRLNMLYAGGSFGRRGNPKSDYLLEAASIARALTGGPHAGKPVKMQWTREDDMRAGFYRPLFLHRLKGAVDADGNPLAWSQRLVGQSIVAGTAFEGMIKNGVDATSVEGAANLPYAIPHFRVDLHSPTLGVPVQWWRSVGSTHTAFATEVFLDELCHAAGKDPVAWRRELLAAHPRHRGVLDLAASQAGWDKPLAPGKAGEKRGRGIAVHESFHSYVAEVAEVTVKADGSFGVDRVVCAVDCGIAVNPDIVRAQMEGGIVFGLTAALYGEVTLREGQVEQSNFTDYPLLRVHEMPKIEVHIVASNEKPTGVGEPGTPVIAPAVANALFAATGKRLRSLPLRLS
ncbi:xanthine dehydrogenase family protein molybdopterin-binding subunit [Sulfurisoma sediminicola]|uniref:Isoquinoline 1-oxidoreductase beta subunit n=1 Tax=Sulfurisoma sediminicola TaxID=1381557 RepID=A0A497XCI1_9PROT|nr:xanthine dehydrogenase family protein molybdopterin-binding subunit [Sulfurisoma sediminicola]RLJ64662.1 isoquinoline 1-oxidoreductase beta subunit [Sulfurisoma sediminicola]